MKTILVSGASGVIGYGVLKSLRAELGAYKLIGTSIYTDSVAPAFCDLFIQAPLTNDASYVDWLRKTVQEHHVGMIIPGIEADMIAWNGHREKIESAGTKALLNNPDLIALCSDKWLFYERLSQSNSQVLIESRLEGSFKELEAAYGLPFLLKPRRGFASKGIVFVNSKAMFDQHADGLGAVLMAQPIVGSNEEEYTVSAFFDDDSTLLCHMGLRRKLAKEGYTEKAVVDSPAGVEEIIRELATLLKPQGPTNFQFRVHNGQLKLLEINPRISSATSIRAAFGYNESVMGVKYYLEGIAPKQPKIKQGYAVRYAEDHIFYASDSI